MGFIMPRLLASLMTLQWYLCVFMDICITMHMLLRMRDYFSYQGSYDVAINFLYFCRFLLKVVVLIKRMKAMM